MTATATPVVTHILSPESPLGSALETYRAPRVPRFADLRLGLLHNGKPGGEHILAGIDAAVRTRYDGISTDSRFKSHPSYGADFLDELVGSWDAAVIAVGDCGACSSFAIRDGVELERRAIPTVVFVSEPFGSMSRLWAERLGAPELAIVVVPHPLAQLAPETLREDFGAANLDQVEQLLVEAGR
jgi:hypothetical protein